MAARLELGSSVDYWRRALNNEDGLSVRQGAPQPGDIAVYGPHRDPLQGGGPDGHTGVVYEVVGNMVICIESRGHIGVCFMARQTSWWSGFIAVDGMTPGIVASMGVWESMYDHLTGTVRRVGYFSGQGRAIIEDDDRIDCSGGVFLVINYGFVVVLAPAEKPRPVIHFTNDEDEVPMFWYAPDGCWHFVHVNADGHLIQSWQGGEEDLTARYGGPKLDPSQPLRCGVNPNSGGLVVDVWGVGFPDPNQGGKRWTVRCALEGNPYRWRWYPRNPSKIDARPVAA